MNKRLDVEDFREEEVVAVLVHDFSNHIMERFYKMMDGVSEESTEKIMAIQEAMSECAVLGVTKERVEKVVDCLISVMHLAVTLGEHNGKIATVCALNEFIKSASDEHDNVSFVPTDLLTDRPDFGASTAKTIGGIASKLGEAIFATIIELVRLTKEK